MKVFSEKIYIHLVDKQIILQYFKLQTKQQIWFVNI